MGSIISANILYLFVFFALWLAAWIPIAIGISLGLRCNPLHPLSPLKKLPFVLSLYAIAPLVLAWILRTFHLPWSAVGYSFSDIRSGVFFLGLFISMIGIGGLFMLFLTMGWATLNQSPYQSTQIQPSIDSEQAADSSIGSSIIPTESETSSPTVVLPSESSLSPWILVPSLFGIGIWVGGVEELIFRGFMIGQLLQSFSIWQAGAIASFIFAILHLVWEGQSNMPQVPGLWVMGMVLTVAWWVDQQAIALAWGLHAGWVGSMATIDVLELIEYDQGTPVWITGVDRKPLAGLAGIAALIATGGVLWALFSGAS